MQNYALLVGSLGLFLVLALLMGGKGFAKSCYLNGPCTS